MGLKSLKKACSLLIMAFILSACGSLTPSSDASDKAAEKKIATAKINVQLGMDYLAKDDVQRAKQKLLTALKQDPKLPEASYAMGYFLEATGNKPEAKQYYLKAISLAPDRGDVQNNYGTFLCRSGDPKGAIQHFLLAVKDSEYLDTASAYENAGLCALNIPSNGLAISYFNEAVKQDPNRPTSLIQLSLLYYKQHNYPTAKKWLDEFYAISPPTALSVWLNDRLTNKNLDHQLSSKNNISTKGHLRWN